MNDNSPEGLPFADTPAPPAAEPPGWLWPLLGACCATIAANIYYGQPLIGLLAPDIGLPLGFASLCVTLTQIGYGLGLLALVPLGDIIQPRRLVVVMLLCEVAALLAVGLSPSWRLFLPGALLVGLAATATQMLVPVASRLAPPLRRGRIIGTVMSGLLIGICLARPAASFLAGAFGWRGVFLASAALMLAAAGLLARVLPSRLPLGRHSYGAILVSLLHLWRRHPVLRRKAFGHAPLFAAFSLFWTIAPVHLMRSLGLGQTGIAWFALAGASGAVAAPIFGRIADRGWSRPATAAAIGCVALAFLLCGLGRGAVPLLASAGIVLDFGVQANLVVSQRAIYGLDPGAVSRLNGVFMAFFFFSGAVGSALASPVYESYGWAGVVCLGAAFAGLALFAQARDLLRPRAAEKDRHDA